MGRELTNEPVCAAVFASAEAAVPGLLKVMFDGPENVLRQTQWAQPAVLTHSLALWRLVQARLGTSARAPVAMLGHSLGEWTALAASGALDVGRAVALVRLRGEAMQQALGGRAGAMLALMPAQSDAVGRVLSELHARGQATSCALANINSSKQVVLSGLADDVAVAAAAVRAALPGVRRFVPLSVSAPFHSPVMQPVCARLVDALSAGPALRVPAFPLVANVTGAPLPLHDAPAAVALLASQAAAPVRWALSLDTCRKQLGVRTFVHVGTRAATLSALARSHWDDAASALRILDVAGAEHIDAELVACMTGEASL